MRARHSPFLWFCLVIAFLFGALHPREGFPQTASELGEAQGNSILSSYGTKSGITNNISNPITSSNTPMRTIDGATSFSGQLQCPNSQRFMEVFIQPGATGDIDTFIVSQDTNFDGNLDYSFQAPFPVSGICANGVITCDPGTWTNCRTYQWTSDTSGRVSLQSVALTALGGCFCVNNSCGANIVFDNTQTVMNVIGGGVAGAIQKNDSRYAISDVVIDGMQATYYGQNSGACTASSSMPATAEQYYYNPGNMSANATAEAVTEAATSTSVYSTLKTASARAGYSVQTCVITRAAYLNWDGMGNCYTGVSTTDGCSILDADPTCKLKEEKVDSVSTIHDYNPTGLVPISSCMPLNGTKTASCSYICPIASNVPCMLDSGSPRCTVGSTTYDCAVYNPIQWAGGNWEIDADEHDTFVRFFGDGNRLCVYAYDFDGNAEGVVAWVALNGANVSGSTPYYPGSFSIHVENGNTLVFGNGSRITVSGLYLEGSVNCSSVQGSWVRMGNSVTCTYGSGAIGFSNVCPLPGGTQCTPETTQCYKTCSDTICEAWWRKERTYTCARTGYDFSSVRRRASTVRQSANDDASSMSYGDYRLSGSTWMTESNSYTTSGVYRGNIGNCQKACKTKKDVDNTATNVSSKKSDVSLDTTTPVFYYHACASAGCPVGTGEAMVTDCQCIDDFAEAAVIMQILRKGAQDIICSDGTKMGLQ